MKIRKELVLIAAIVLAAVVVSAIHPGIALASSGNAELIVTAFEYPEMLLPGTEFEAVVTLKNIGTRTASKIRFSYSALSDGVFPTNNVHFFPVENIKPGKTAEIAIALTVREHTLAGDQKVHIDVTYEDSNFGEFTLSDEFRIETFSQTSVAFDELENGMEITVPEDYMIPTNVYNTGYAPIYNIYVEFETPGGQKYKSFYRELLPGEAGYSNVKFFLWDVPNSKLANSDGSFPFTYTVTYDDMFGETHTETRIYDFYVLPQPTSEPRETPEPAKVNTQGQYWIVLLVIVAVIAIVSSISLSAAVVRKTKIK